MANEGRRGPVLSLVSRDRDIAYYLREVEQRGGGPVLVLGAGTGRIAWELALSGIDTLAVDPSAAMLETAEARRAQEPEEGSRRLQLVHADVRALRLERRFPVVLAPQNALALMATLDDLDAMLATVRHHLAEKGTLIFDVLNPVRELPSPDFEDWHPLEGVEPPRPVFAPHLRERNRRDGIEGIRRLRLRHFSVAEIDRALSDAAFVPTERYGSFTRTPFEAADPIQVVIAEKGDSLLFRTEK
ncbi:MAG: class I SAM-dependent methyltransferase [Myxococcaceae bacterium]